MANIKSSKKRIKVSERNRFQNRYIKSSIKTLTKSFLKLGPISKNMKSEKTRKKHKEIRNLIYSLIDKGTKKNIFHKNKAARKKSNLSRLINKKNEVSSKYKVPSKILDD